MNIDLPKMKTYSFSQIKLYLFEHDTSFQWNELPVETAQSSMFRLLGSPGHQFVYWAIVWVDIQTHSPSTNMSVNPIQKLPERVRMGFQLLTGRDLLGLCKIFNKNEDF